MKFMKELENEREQPPDSIVAPHGWPLLLEVLLGLN